MARLSLTIVMRRHRPTQLRRYSVSGAFFAYTTIMWHRLRRLERSRRETSQRWSPSDEITKRKQVYHAMSRSPAAGGRIRQ